MIKSKNELEQKISKAIPALKEFWDLLLKWQKSVNLISPKTIENGWDRHILDSAQLYFLIENSAKKMMDVGSGGGFPGMVIAILNQALKGPLKEIILVESDLKKSLFLQEATRLLKVNVVVKRDRIENLKSKPDVITARAFAPLSELLTLVKQNVSRETILILPKGKSVDDEIQSNHYRCEIEKLENIINPEGTILKIKEVDYE